MNRALRRTPRSPIGPARAACACALALAHATSGAAAEAQPDPAALYATTDEPRAFGYQVGERLARKVVIHAPPGLVLDDASVPQAGARGAALELRSVARRESGDGGGQRIELAMHYQVFLSPAQSRTLEMPSFTLHFDGQPRAQDLRIDAWPVTVSPLVPTEVSPRRGLGELQPDAAPPPIDTTAGRRRLALEAVAMLALLGYLAEAYIGLPWRSRAQRPFALAWRALRGIAVDAPASQWRTALQRVHEALNRTAGEVVFEHGVDRFVAARPQFTPLRDDLRTFFAQSRDEFFASGRLAGPAERRWLLEFCRRCRAAERDGS